MSHFSWLARWLPVIALIAFVSLARVLAAFGDCNPGFGMCNHQKGTPETLTQPDLFVDYWGPEWGNGNFLGNPGFSFTTPSGVVVTASQYVPYLEEFLQTIAGSSYLDTQTQYGAGNAPLFLGDWFDQSEPPDTPTDNDIKGEVINAYAHFAGVFGSNDQVIIVIALPPGHGVAGFKPVLPAPGGPICAYHGYTSAIFGQNGPPWTYYIVLPFEPEKPSCGGFMPTPIASSDSFGHGVLDGVSHAGGHELAEVLTDPVGGSWYASSSSNGETGDLCANVVTDIGSFENGVGFYWSAQALWSNSDVQSGGTGCVFGDSSNVTAPSSLDFGSLQVGVISAGNTQAVTAGNSGTADFTNVAQPSPWVLDDPTNSFRLIAAKCPSTLHPGDQCQVPVGFVPNPNQVGVEVQATLYFNSNSGGGTQHVTSTILTGTGTPAPPINWIPNFIFPPGLLAQLCEECPQVQQGQISNQDSSPHTVGTVGLTELSASDFAIANDGCSGVTLEGGGSCRVGILFTPQVTGERFGLVDFLDETGIEHSALLEGVGLGPVAQVTGAALGATGLVFPSGSLGTTQVEPLILTAGGRAPLTIKSITASGDFAETNNCPRQLVIGTSCTINVSLTPTHYQYQAGVLTITDDASDSPQSVLLSGSAEGSFALASPGKLNFGFVPLNIASRPLTVMLQGLEGAPFHVNSITASGDFSETDDCPAPPSTLNSFCTISIIFTPSAIGTRAGGLTIVDDATNGNQSIALSGIGAGLASGGAFVIGDGDAALGSHVTFWGSQWASANTLSGGAAPASFKGFENGVVNPVCGTAWSAGPGSSSNPPGTVPTYMAVIVSSKIAKQGSSENGNTASIAVVQTAPGYQPNPGHPGTGTVVGKACN